MTVRTARVDVAVELPGVRSLGVDVFLPPPGADERRAVLWCLPGGGFDRRYFDLGGAGDASYSMARWFAARGHPVVALDHPGTGSSDRPDDPWRLDPPTVADVDAAGIRAVADRFGLADRPSIGVGHSMGGLITCHVQARHRAHRALVLLGFGPDGLPSALDDEELAVAGDPERARRQIPRLVDRRFGTPLAPPSPREGPSLLREGLPPSVADRVDEGRTDLLALCGFTSMVPGASDPVLAEIDVPVFVGVGELDIARPAHAIPRVFTGSDDVTLHVLAGGRHLHVAEPSRTVQWDRIAAWLDALAL